MVLFPLQAVSRKTISVTSTTRYRGKRYFLRVQWRCWFSLRVSRSNFKRNVESWVCSRCDANGITAVLREADFGDKWKQQKSATSRLPALATINHCNTSAILSCSNATNAHQLMSNRLQRRRDRGPESIGSRKRHQLRHLRQPKIEQLGPAGRKAGTGT